MFHNTMQHPDLQSPQGSPSSEMGPVLGATFLFRSNDHCASHMSALGLLRNFSKEKDA